MAVRAALVLQLAMQRNKAPPQPRPSGRSAARLLRMDQS